MKKLLIGVFLGVFLSVSAFEIIHQTVELSVEGSGMCAIIYDELTKRWNPDFTYRLKLVYKLFAYPVKIIYVSLSEKQIAIKDGTKPYIVRETR